MEYTNSEIGFHASLRQHFTDGEPSHNPIGFTAKLRNIPSDKDDAPRIGFTARLRERKRVQDPQLHFDFSDALMNRASSSAVMVGFVPAKKTPAPS